MAKVPPVRPGSAFRAAETAESKRRAASQGPWAGSYARTIFDFSDVSVATLADGISHALTRGSAITFSLTSDGGAVKVTLWADGQKHQAYAGDADTLNELMSALIVEAPGE